MPTFFNNVESAVQATISSVDKKWSKELYGNDSKFFFKFETIPIVDNITGKRATIISSGSKDRPFVENGAFGKALRMRPQSEISYNTNMPTSLSQFSLGFWLQPVSVEPSIDSLTGQMQYYRLSLFDKASFIENGSSNSILSVEDDTTFVLYEECLETNNRLYIHLQSGAGEESVFYTTEYSTGQFHHFWITYHGPGEVLNVYIDGILIDLIQTSGDGVPESVNVNQSVPFHINKSAIGSSGSLRGNFGLIDELVFQIKLVNDENIIARHINYGTEYAINDELLHREETHQAFAYDDPTTIDVTSVYSNGTNIYAGRSDGQVFKGDRTMWKVRRDFSNRDEIRFVKKNFLAANHIVDVEDGSLKLFKASVRI